MPAPSGALLVPLSLPASPALPPCDPTLLPPHDSHAAVFTTPSSGAVQHRPGTSHPVSEGPMATAARTRGCGSMTFRSSLCSRYASTRSCWKRCTARHTGRVSMLLYCNLLALGRDSAQLIISPSFQSYQWHIKLYYVVGISIWVRFTRLDWSLTNRLTRADQPVCPQA